MYLIYVTKISSNTAIHFFSPLHHHCSIEPTFSSPNVLPLLNNVKLLFYSLSYHKDIHLKSSIYLLL